MMFTIIRMMSKVVTATSADSDMIEGCQSASHMT